MKRIFFTGVLFLIALSGLSYAAMYQWTDRDGVKHFSNTPTNFAGAEYVDIAVEVKRTEFREHGVSDNEIKMRGLDNLRENDSKSSRLQEIELNEKIRRQKEKESKVKELEADLRRKEKDFQNEASRRLPSDLDKLSDRVVDIAVKKRAVTEAKDELDKVRGTYNPAIKQERADADRQFQLEQMERRMDVLERENLLRH